jgi:hypothetical protein
MPAPLLLAFLIPVLEAIVVAAVRAVMLSLLLKIDAIREAWDLLCDTIRREIYMQAEYLIVKSLEVYLGITLGDKLDAHSLTTALNAQFGTHFTDITDRAACERDALEIAKDYLADALEINRSKLNGRAGMVAAVKAATESAVIEALETGGGAFGFAAQDFRDALTSSVDGSFKVKKVHVNKDGAKAAGNRARQQTYRDTHKPYKWVDA